MACEWRETTLGEFVSLQRGHDLTEDERSSGDVPVMGSAGKNGTHNQAKAKGPGIVIGRSGASFGQVHYSPVDFWPHNTALYVTDFHGNDPRFAYYFLRSFDFTRYNSGSAQPSLNRNFLHPIEIVVPDIGEQRAIARILGALDDKIELNRQMNETLETIARSLFKSWYVDFDPVRAKVGGRDPGLPKPLADLFPSRLIDSELGEIPEGWNIVPLPEAIEVNPTRSLRKGKMAPYLDMANMPTKGHTPDVVVDRLFGSGMRFTNGDTLVARITPCLENGKTAFVDFLRNGEIGWGSTEYIVLRPKSPLPEEFAYCLARSSGFREFAIQSMTGSSGRQRVPAESMGHYLLAVPSPDLAAHFGELVRPLLARAAASASESRSLAEIRDVLLPQLISGAMRIESAGALVRKATGEISQ